MVSQLNPAWQRKSASSSRLSEIDARFPEGTAQATADAAPCRTIPFLLDTPAQAWITDALSGILSESGHPCIVWRPGDPGSSRRDAGESALVAVNGSYRLLTVSSPAALLEQRHDHVVMPVPANIDAIRTAYRRIKLLSQHGAPDIGVVLVGPRDQHAAWRYFRKLAVGTLRYLDVPLFNLGFLPEQTGPGEEAEASHGRSFLTRIGERLLHSGFYSAPTTDEADKTR
jgi:hypothetical protein